MSDSARHAMVVSGPAAFVLTRLLKRDDVERRLDDAGFGGSTAAEAFREEVLSAVDRFAEHGEAWHAAWRGEEQGSAFNATFNESRAPDAGRQSRAMYVNALTQQEAAEVLTVTRQRVGQLRKSGELFGWQDDRGRWLYDRDEVHSLAEERQERTPAR